MVVVEVVYTVLLEAGFDAGAGTPCTSDELGVLSAGAAVVAGAGLVSEAVEDVDNWTCVSGRSVEGSGAVVLEEALDCGAAAVVAALSTSDVDSTVLVGGTCVVGAVSTADAVLAAAVVAVDGSLEAW